MVPDHGGASMPQKWAVVSIAVAFLSVGTVIGTLIAPGSLVAALEPERLGQPKEFREARAPRIAYVNIAKVLRDYRRASAEGSKITRKRQAYAEKIKPLRDSLAKLSLRIQRSIILEEKEQLQKEALAINRQIEDLDREAQKIVGELTDRTIIEVYDQIQGTIAALANERGLDVIEAYPDASTPEDARKPPFISLKLQTPALMPYYVRKEFDLTDEVIGRLNRNYPPDI
jgi:Skp family chaperone for outer membrane proteins